jgi:EmrB/QacA subfamily drug resistance transporter
MPLTSSPDAPTTLDRRTWGTLLVLCGALFLDALDVSLVSVALPSIRTDVHLSTSTLQWVLSGYVLGYGGFLLLGGWAADLLGRRRVFLVSLGVFVVASGLGGLATGGAVLIATRFVKGVSAAFTAPAGLSIITTHFAEGPVRNRALSIYAATGATGFSSGLVFGGLLTQLGWRYVFFLPVVVAAATLLGAVRLVPHDVAGPVARRHFDLPGAVLLTGAMFLLVFTLVEAPSAGWASARTISSLAGVVLLLGIFVWQERRSVAPLLRLGILRSASLVRANVGGMALTGGWFGFLFIAQLYMQQLRGWSPIQAGLAVLPAAALVALLSTRMGPLVDRFGPRLLVAVGLSLGTVAYLLFLPIGAHTNYAAGLLPTFVLTGLNFALSLGSLSIAATNGIAPHEQGLAGGLLNTSFQFGGALMLAIVTAVSHSASHGDRLARRRGSHRRQQAAASGRASACAVGPSELSASQPSRRTRWPPGRLSRPIHHLTDLDNKHAIVPRPERNPRNVRNP